jgi:hypothetical protein
MTSSLLTPTLLATANQSSIYRSENENGGVESQTHARMSFNDDGENDSIAGNRRQSNAPLSITFTRSPSCNEMTSGARRPPTEQQAGRPGEAQLPQPQGRQSQSSDGPQQETEREVVLPATTTTMSRKALFVLRPVHRYVDLVCIGLSVLAYLLETTMNAALAIFGIGVGVGLVLGDSFRAALPMLPSAQAAQQQQQQGTAMTNSATMAGAQAGNEIISPPIVPNLLPAQ